MATTTQIPGLPQWFEVRRHPTRAPCAVQGSLAAKLQTGQVNVRVLIVGGDARTGALTALGTGFRAYPSPRNAGTGSVRRALRAIVSGTVDLVVLLVRWLGHPDFHAVVNRCRSVGVRYLVVAGGHSAARRAVAEALGAL